MDLVIHHMLQALVVCGTKKDLGIDLAPSVSGVHNLKEVKSTMKLRSCYGIRFFFSYLISPRLIVVLAEKL